MNLDGSNITFGLREAAKKQRREYWSLGRCIATVLIVVFVCVGVVLAI